MIKVVRHGYINKCECYSCKSILSFDRREDMREVPVGDERIHFYIDCPVCFNEVFLGWQWKDGSVFYPGPYMVED